MTSTLTYRCPQCHEAIEIEPDAVGQSVACPGCSQPVTFEVERAIPIEHPEPGEPVHRIASDEATIEGQGFEKELDVRHPAMFRAHPWRWILSVAVAIAGLGWGVWAMIEDAPFIGGLIATIIGAAAAIYFFIWWLDTRYTRVRVTNVRTIYRKGIISKHSTEVRHDDVRNLQVDQSAPERIVGVGEIAISSAGQDGLEIVAKDIPKPNEVIEIIRSHQHPQ